MGGGVARSLRFQGSGGGHGDGTEEGKGRGLVDRLLFYRKRVRLARLGKHAERDKDRTCLRVERERSGGEKVNTG